MSTDARADYFAAIDHFLGCVQAAAGTDLEAPGLGEWSRRELIAHTARALSTVDEYLVDDPALPVEVTSAGGYFAALASTDHKAVAARGRQAATDAGDDLVGHVTGLAEVVRSRVSAAAPQARATTRGGVMLLDTYLPTRTFELVVHSLDLDPSRKPSDELLGLVLGILADTALARGLGPEAIQALTGRRDGFTLLA